MNMPVFVSDTGALLSEASPPRAAYVHVPFCRHRCGYCNFTLVARRDDLIEAYLAGLARELAGLGEPQSVDTLFIGGGTPTHLPPAGLGRLLSLVRTWFELADGGEFTVEANPADVDPARIAVLADWGVSRLSLGAQSFDDGKLALLERDHRALQIVRAVELARPNVRSVSIDLIFGAPGESLSLWQSDLAAALRLPIDHVSTYGLTFERGTTFWGRLIRGELARPAEELERSLYAEAIDTLEAAGLDHYEVSNFARPGHRCRHNEVYWSAAEYYAAGPGAARYVGGRREVNHRSTTTWLKRVLAGQSPVAETETLSPEDRSREALVLALRRLEGIDRGEFTRRTGFTVDELVGPALARHRDWGLLEEGDGRVRLTREGLYVSDSIWPHFLRQ